MGGEQADCPVCGQSVETVVKRHKTLGAWVPVWGRGPCRNPGCTAYTGSGGTESDRHPGPGPAAGGRNDGGRASGRPGTP
ncbi:hypothetical protein [Streptomyces nogalater]|uniref:Uncharacterized protein n=1 Tax=Streptomyces nogalater TaxID=38314 RepID=A0ABW0WPU7_STRNO